MRVLIALLLCSLPCFGQTIIYQTAEPPTIQFVPVQQLPTIVTYYAPTRPVTLYAPPMTFYSAPMVTTYYAAPVRYRVVQPGLFRRGRTVIYYD